MDPSPNFDVADGKFRAAFQLRLREIQGKRTDGDMADLLGVNPDRYKKWKNRPGSQFPMFLLPKLCRIGETTIKELLESVEKTASHPPAAATKGVRKRSAA